MALGDHRVGRFFCRRLPALGLPAGGWNAVRQRAANHEHKVNRRHGHKALPHAHTVRPGKMVHQCGRQRCAHHCPATKAHDRHARSHATLVREPLDQCRHRRDITQPQADTADNPRTQPHQPDLMGINTQCRNQQTAAPAQSRHHTGLAWPGMLKPAAPYRGRATEEDKEQGVDPAEHRNRPVALRRKHLRDKAHVWRTSHRCSHAQGFGQRQPEHRKAIGHADAQMDGQSSWRHQPAVEAGFGDDALLGQERRRRSRTARSNADTHRCFPQVMKLFPRHARSLTLALCGTQSFLLDRDAAMCRRRPEKQAKITI